MLKICQDYEREKLERYNGMFANKIITHYDQNYLILNINFCEAYFKCLKIYDKHGIKIDINSNTNLACASKFYFDKLYDNCVLHSKEESDKIIDDYHKDDKNILRIYYELISSRNPEIFNDNLNFQRFKSSSSIIPSHNEDAHMEVIGEERKINEPRTAIEEKEIIPYKILPDNVDLNHYNIIIQDNKITNIQAKDDENLSILYEANLIKEQAGGRFKGLVANSLMKVYTSMYNKDIVNIVHIHLNDTSEEIAIDSLFLEKSEMISDHKNFKLDAFGKKLNYKLIFRDFKVICS